LNAQTRLSISLTINAPAGATVFDALRAIGDPGYTPPGYELVSLSMYPEDPHRGPSCVPVPVPAPELPPAGATTEQPPAPAPEPTVSKSRAKRLAAQGAPAEQVAAATPPAQIAPEDRPDAGQDAPAPEAAPPAAPVPTVEELRAVVKELIDAGRGARVKAILTGIKASSVSDIPEALRAEALKSLQLAVME
jgi:hypothetical protein